MGHRIPLIRTSAANAVFPGALHREVFSSPASMCRRSTNQTSGPGKASRTAMPRSVAHSTTMGPWLPSLMVWRGHASVGDPIHRQHHRLDRLAWQRRPHPLEVGVRCFPLFTPLKQRTVDGVLGAQLLHQVRNILDRQLHLWRCLDQIGHAALLPHRGDGQHYTTFRILVVVLGPRRGLRDGSGA
jgi:hypothetical protein